MKIRYCESCSCYTLSKNCPKCEKNTIEAGPGPYTFKSKWSKYRRKGKRND